MSPWSTSRMPLEGFRRGHKFSVCFVVSYKMVQYPPVLELFSILRPAAVSRTALVNFRHSSASRSGGLGPTLSSISAEKYPSTGRELSISSFSRLKIRGLSSLNRLMCLVSSSWLIFLYLGRCCGRRASHDVVMKTTRGKNLLPQIDLKTSRARRALPVSLPSRML